MPGHTDITCMVTMQIRTGYTCSLTFLSPTHMNRNICSWREIQCWPGRRRCKILSPRASQNLPNPEGSSSLPIQAFGSDQALSPNAAANTSRSSQRNLRQSLDNIPLWKSLNNASEEMALTLQHQLEHAIKQWPGGNEQFFLPIDVQDRLLTANNIAKEFERLFKGLSPTEQQNYVTRICSSARKLFAILLGIEKGASIIDFLSDGITDHDLPLVKYTPMSAISSYTLRAKRRIGSPIQAIGRWTWLNIRNFYREQWGLQAPVFDTLCKHYELHDDCVLPFVEDKEGNIGNFSGGYSDVWAVRIHPAHQLLFKLTNPRYPVPLIAVKRLHSTDKEDFDKEQSMLKSIAEKNHPHIVKLLATYTYKNRYHLLFPWAPCNLRVFWANNPNPKWDRINVLWMLEQLQGLSSGLCEVHNFKIDKPTTTTLTVPAVDRSRLFPGSVNDITVAEDEFRYGRHGDLKPENILWSDELDKVSEMGVLQIADFGLGRFHGRASRSAMLAKQSVASPTYEPPEIPLDRKVSRAYDIWSLGCIFLEFITWRLGGLQLVGRFHGVRVADGGDGTENDKFFTVINYKEPGQDAVVRKEVQDWMDTLHKHPCCSVALQELLALVRGRMLVIPPKKRIPCKDLRDHLTRLLERARHDEILLLGDVPQVYTLHEDVQMVEKHETPEITVYSAPSEEG